MRIMTEVPIQKKYCSDYQVDKILAGCVQSDIVDRAKKAKFDERLALLDLVLDALTCKFLEIDCETKTIKGVFESLARVRNSMFVSGDDPVKSVDKEIDNQREIIVAVEAANGRSDLLERVALRVIAHLENERSLVSEKMDAEMAFSALKDGFERIKAEAANRANATSECLSNAFRFFERAFGDGQEMLVFVTELTANIHASSFIARFGCKEYFAHNKELLFYERHVEIISELEKMELRVGE